MNKSKKIAIIALMSTFSIILATVANFQIPFLTFFKPDFSDVPIFILSFIFGGKYGLLSLFIVSLVRMLTGDVILPAAFALRMSSSIVVIFINFFCNVIARIPISYYMWVNCYNVPKEIFINNMWASIILLTIVRLLINITISKLIFNYLSKNRFLSKLEN